MQPAPPYPTLPTGEEQRSSIVSLLQDLRAETLHFALPGFLAVGAALIVAAPRFRDPLQIALPGLGLFLLAGAVWILDQYGHSLAVWTLVAACTAVLLILIAVGPLPTVIYLLWIPVGLAAVCAGDRAGLMAAAAATVYLAAAPPVMLAGDGLDRVTSGFAVWAAVGLVWLSHRPLVGVLEWSWTMYQEGQRKLERTRDDRVRLHEALADLATANLTLTKLKQAAHAMQEVAEEARRAKEQFVANVSHELRTPLNMIVGFCELIVETPEMYGEIPPALLADLDVVLRNGQHLASLIDDVLDLSQIDAQRMALVRERLNLAEIVNEAADAVKPLYTSKGLYLRLSVPIDLSPVFGDRIRVRQVLLNLLSNAGRFTEKGGVTVRAWKEANHVHIAVQDTGPGIAPVDAARLFEPFQQVDGSLRRKHGGSGLGLSISKAFVELHGGRLWVESDAGKGATFLFTLPTLLPEPYPTSAARWLNAYQPYEPRTRPSAAPKPVLRPHLVVLETADSLTRFLQRHMQDVEIIAVRELDEAIEQCSHLPPDALIVNAASVSASLDAIAHGNRLPPSVPVIVCSLPGTADVAGEMGLAGYLVKPIRQKVLLQTLDELDLPNRTVLVVDDEPEVQRLFRRILLSARPAYTVLRAANGRQGLELLQTQRPDIVLLDLVMPEMDGFAFLSAKNRDARLRDIPVIAISAQDPSGQPFVSKQMAVTSAHGMTASQVLAMIDHICHAFRPQRESHAVQHE